MAGLWQTLYDKGVDVVLNGHEHNYQRFAPLNRNANDDDPLGIRYFIVGTGGRPITPASHGSGSLEQTLVNNGMLRVWMDGSSPGAGYGGPEAIGGRTTAGQDSDGILKLTLHSSSYDWQFLPTTSPGFTFTDTGSSPCRDTDSDGWTDGSELTIGTDRLDACANTRARNDEPSPDAWPADFDDDAISDITDISVLTGAFGEAVPPSPARNDVAPEMPDGFVDITDIARLTGIFGAACPSGLPPFSAGGPSGPGSGSSSGKISLDMVTAGNAYSESTNSMSLGTVDHCLASLLGNNTAHNHIAHLTIQDVTDLVGWQARLHYQGGKMRPLNVNYTPFTDTTTGQDLGFVNLPKDQATGEHRDITSASSIPAAQPGAQTALVGAAYNGAQSAEISPDTPPKIPPDDTSYAAPNGGVLAAVNIRVEAGQSGQQLLLSEDGAYPDPPGSSVVVFTETGTSTIDLDGGALWDGVHAEGVPCEPAPP